MLGRRRPKDTRPRAHKINTKVDQLQSRYAERDAEAVEEYCTMVLSNSQYPEQFPQNFTVDYDQAASRVIVNYQLPSCDDLDFLETATVVKKARAD